jgi:putative endonuclease
LKVKEAKSVFDFAFFVGPPRQPQLAAAATDSGWMREPDSPSRSSHGAGAEAAVARYLSDQGFDVIATNLRIGRLELDVVARRADLIVVVEVRFRGAGSWTSGFGSILPEKRRRVRRAAEILWRRRYARDASVSRLRIDAAAVVLEGTAYRITYCPGAF